MTPTPSVPGGADPVALAKHLPHTMHIDLQDSLASGYADIRLRSVKPWHIKSHSLAAFKEHSLFRIVSLFIQET